MRAVIFDLDGTLIDSLPDLRTSLNAVLTDYGYECMSTEEVKNMIGGGPDVLLAGAFRHAGAEIDPKTLIGFETPYPPPDSPDLTLDTSKFSINQSVEAIYQTYGDYAVTGSL